MMNGIIMWRCGLIRKRFWMAASDLGIPSYLHVIFLQENHMKTLWKNSVWIPDFLRSKHIHVKYNNVAAESKTIGQCGLQNSYVWCQTLTVLASVSAINQPRMTFSGVTYRSAFSCNKGELSRPKGKIATHYSDVWCAVTNDDVLVMGG